jgi:hypothetical protein
MKNKGFIISTSIIILVLICINVLTIFSNKLKTKELKELNTLYQTAQSDLTISRNQYDEEVAKVEVLTSEKSTLFIKLNIANAEIIELQKLVAQAKKENKDLNTALIISTESNLKLKDSIRNLIVGYTPDPINPDQLYPVYEKEYVAEWSYGKITMGLDSLDLNIVIKNKYSVTIGDEKVSLFKKKLYADVTNHNPDTETKTMKVYQEEEVKDNTIKKVGIVGLITFLIGLAI